MYANDTQIYTSFSPGNTATAVDNLEQCISKSRDWMSENHLKSNDTKNELIVVANHSVMKQCNIPSIYRDAYIISQEYWCYTGQYSVDG